MKLETNHVEALRRLYASPDFRLFVSAIGDYAESLNQQMLFNKEFDVFEMRGRAQAVVTIIKAIDHAMNDDRR